ncbi:hypothetical protein [Mesorhizobium sp. M7A.F.Ca.ET.027.03.2.1]|uniref:hypothetical protein n=1 Tax=Mesorhizobium sp. M7A.F.Ca.ET.027.03.2.1 TaxID=2496656 RepID=UPI000FCC7E7B|nr:hypothetical protein [Mesorhizobium sp. M7A.F.Ca.ET.027.03.2.1]RVD64207.1 hypothetical protein EN750_13770 [Mesorhizobium sp. M7A.F.Ca.ET.027.03.2.1]
MKKPRDNRRAYVEEKQEAARLPDITPKTTRLAASLTRGSGPKEHLEEVMQTQNGYWWAISIRQDDGRPEIIDVGTYSFGQMANRIGDSDPFDLFEFELLQHVDTSAWPQTGKVDPGAVSEGYWWAVDPAEEAHQIVLVGKDGAVQDFNGDFGSSLDAFEFLMPIDTSGWPTALPVD